MLTEKNDINYRKMNAKRKQRLTRNQSRNSAMSTKTKDFIQKICYRKTASIDMTRYGFINDSKLHPVNLLLKPLRAQLEKICGKPRNASGRKYSPVRKKVTICIQGTKVPVSIDPRPVAMFGKRSPVTRSPRSVAMRTQGSPLSVTRPPRPVVTCTQGIPVPILRSPRQCTSPNGRASNRSPISAVSSPGTRTPNRALRKVTIQTPMPQSLPTSGKKKRVTLVTPPPRDKNNEFFVKRC